MCHCQRFHRFFSFTLGTHEESDGHAQGSLCETNPLKACFFVCWFLKSLWKGVLAFMRLNECFRLHSLFIKRFAYKTCGYRTACATRTYLKRVSGNTFEAPQPCGCLRPVIRSRSQMCIRFCTHPHQRVTSEQYVVQLDATSSLSNLESACLRFGIVRCQVNVCDVVPFAQTCADSVRHR